MRIAIAIDQDFVSEHFGCCLVCTIVDMEDGKIRGTLIIPNPGCRHEYWAELFFRNSIKHVIVGNIGSRALSVLRWWGIEVIPGAEGRIDDVVRRFAQGELRTGACTEPEECGSIRGPACSGIRSQ